MRISKLETKEVLTDTHIKCDRCGKTVSIDDEYEEAQEFLELEERGGYGSVFGDGVLIQLDLCQHCQKELFGEYVRLTD
jgi:Fe2+ or Zn2+ uptake regulation protein